MNHVIQERRGAEENYQEELNHRGKKDKNKYKTTERRNKCRAIKDLGLYTEY